MNRRCIIHIGHAKTATTYLQHCLHLNEALFRQHAYFVPGDFARFGFQDLVQLSQAGIVLSGNLAPLHEVMARHPDPRRREMEDYLFTPPANMPPNAHVILSSELFFYYPIATATLVATARAHGLTPEVIAYVTRQDRAAIPGYLQNVRQHGFDAGVIDFLAHDPRMGYMHYLRAMSRLHDAANGVPITLRTFDRRFLVGGDVFADFLATTQLPIAHADCILPRAVSNEGLLLEQYELLRAAALLHRPDAAERLAARDTPLTPDQRHRAQSYYYRPPVQDFLAQHYIPANTELLDRFMPTATETEREFWRRSAVAGPPVALDTFLLERLRAEAFG